ncbi:MAG: phosphatidylinositol mannoside acyltransferase [Acidimicrobiia bacterium]
MTRSGSAAIATHLAYRGASVLALKLPERVALPTALVAARVLGRAMRSRRRMLARHQQRVHGRDLSAGDLRRCTRMVLDSYGRYWIEAFRLPARTADSLAAHVDYEGIEHVDAALAAGRGVLITLPHLGNWDMGGAWLAARGYGVAAVVEALEPPELFAWFTRLRAGLGVEAIPLGDGTASAVLRALAANKLVGLICDRDLNRSGVEVEFFGERTTLPAGPATLSLRSKAPILPSAIYFRPGGRHLVVIRPPLPTERRGSLGDDVARITQALTTEIEALIRRAPEQWHLLQPNWPSDYSCG